MTEITEITIRAINADNGSERWAQVMNALVALGEPFTVTVMKRERSPGDPLLDAVIRYGIKNPLGGSPEDVRVQVDLARYWMESADCPVRFADEAAEVQAQLNSAG